MLPYPLHCNCIGKSPIYTQKSPAYPEKSPIYTQTIPVYTQTSPIHTQKRPVYPQIEPLFQRQINLCTDISTLPSSSSSSLSRQTIRRHHDSFTRPFCSLALLLLCSVALSLSLALSLSRSLALSLYRSLALSLFRFLVLSFFRSLSRSLALFCPLAPRPLTHTFPRSRPPPLSVTLSAHPSLRLSVLAEASHAPSCEPPVNDMGCERFTGSLHCPVSFTKEPCQNRALFQKRLKNEESLHVAPFIFKVATATAYWRLLHPRTGRHAALATHTLLALTHSYA